MKTIDIEYVAVGEGYGGEGGYLWYDYNIYDGPMNSKAGVETVLWNSKVFLNSSGIIKITNHKTDKVIKKYYKNGEVVPYSVYKKEKIILQLAGLED